MKNWWIVNNFACLKNSREFNEIKFKDLLKTYSSDTEVNEMDEFTTRHQQIKIKKKEFTIKYNKSLK